MWHVDEVIRAVKGTPFRIERDTFSDISTDSRGIEEGELFIPLMGKTYDGHMFIEASYIKSHGGSICEKKREDIYRNAKGTIILVDDTTRALLDLARYKRERTKGTFIAITGSNGKTTTKEILVSMIKNVFPVAYNEKNYNNTIGVSKSILSIDGEPAFCVFELGTNSRGEIRMLAEVTEPDISLITNINPSHLEGLYDIEGVLEEKLDLFYLTKEGGAVFINADDPYILPRYKDINHVLYTYGIVNEASFRLSIDQDLGWQGFNITLKFSDDELKTRTSLLGRHNLYNILSASSIAYGLNLDKRHIKEVVETFNPYAMRFKPIQSKKGYIVVDDSYNANPSSMEWAINTLQSLPCNGKRIVIIGDMKELGEKTSYYHRELGRFLRESSIPMVVMIGEDVRETFYELGEGRSKLFENKKALINYVTEKVKEGDVILVKGSRVVKMEEIVEALV